VSGPVAPLGRVPFGACGPGGRSGRHRYGPVEASWLESDVTVCGLGSYQEIDGRVALAADRIFVDNWEACRQRGNLAPIIQSGALAREAIDGEVPDLVAGKLPGRSPNDGTILIALVGIGALDIALGAELLRLARSRGVGRALV